MGVVAWRRGLIDGGTDSLGPAVLPVRQWPERRVVVLAVAGLLLIGVLITSLLSARAPDKFEVLYVLPVMLAGLELGVTGGAGAAVLALGLALAPSRSRTELGAGGLAALGVVFLAAGMLAGRFSARMRAAIGRQERLLASGLRLARVEGVDALPTVLAEELRQALDVSGVRVQLFGAHPVEFGSLAGEVLRLPISTRGVEYGVLSVSVDAQRPLGEEDRVVAEKLASQAAVAADNHRLLASERERAALHAELEHTRRRMAEHLRNVGRILDSQEAERREIARHLHEEAAQALGAILLGLGVLERDLDRELTRNQLQEVRDIARDTLGSLRRLAVGMRPPSLDDLGLRAALEGIAEREAARGSRPITLDCDECPVDLGPEVETCAYHLVEDAIRALDGALQLRVSVDQDHASLRIELSGAREEAREPLLRRLATAQARLELIGGTLNAISSANAPTAILAEIPLSVSPDHDEAG